MQKSIQITLIWVLTVSLAGAQSFGLPGTAWEHCWTPALELPPTTYIVKTMAGAIYERDGMDCNVLYFSSQYDPKIGDSISICRSGDQVFYLEGDSMYLLYDFALKAGDTLSVRYPHGFDSRLLTDRPDDDDDLLITIDSVTIENIMSVALRRQHIRLLSDNPFVSIGSSILERVGFECWVLPHFGYIGLDGDGFLGLRSYKDDQVIFEDESVCDTRVSIISEDYKFQLEIYPNPAHEYLIVDAKELIRGITIYDLTGRSISFEVPQFGSKWDLRLDTYAPGIYFAEVSFGDRVEIRKIVVRKSI